MANNTVVAATNFHDYSDLVTAMASADKKTREFTYKFENFFHPLVTELIERLSRQSLPGLFDPVAHEQMATQFFAHFYTALTSLTVKVRSFPKDIDLRTDGPYANYNWELLFHIPLTIAVHLSKNRRFAEAQRWFHFIFDPTCTDTTVEPPQRFWRFLAFRDAAPPLQIDELLALLSKENPTDVEAELRQSILDGYNEIKNRPFQPHVVARTRPIAYQFCVVMKYLDNLIAWGDHLFRQDTIESINEATQRYVLAANLLGARPQRIPRTGTVRPLTFAQLKQRGLDPTGNALVDLEGKFPLNLGLPQVDDALPDAPGPLFGSDPTLYFCIPRNDKLLGYWDTVADRLFKIRNCMNIEGVVRQLALFDPPIDPGMLVKAAAAGIDIGSIVSGLSQPAGPVRASLLIQKALELCGEVRGMGSALLSAIEKGDSERMALLRQGHEVRIQQMQQDVRFLQWKQAQESTEALLRGRASAVERYRYYLRLLGLSPDNSNVPNTLPLNRADVTEANFDEVYGALVGQYEKAVAPIAYPQLDTRQEGRLHLHVGEFEDLNGHADRALAARISASAAEVVRAALSLIPTFHLKAAYWGMGGDARVGGGDPLSTAGTAVTAGFNIWAQVEERMGQGASKTSSYTRRADDWMLQANLAVRELAQMGRQLIGSLIAEQIAHREYVNIQEQIKNSQEVDEFLRSKFSNDELYAWMQGEISRLYYEYYRFAFDTARKAEQTMKRELMRPELDSTDLVKFNYWDGGRRGLLSGDALYLDAKRMDMAYHEHNRREYELTKHVSLLQVDPLALIELRATGRCTVRLPEELFDMDGPGHYFRRIKSVAVSIPCVTGPYAGVNCTLTLLKSSIRTTPVVGEAYARADAEDARFSDYFGSLQSIVTSSGQNDSGLFETNLRDERYLPFENSGVIGEWQLQLPANPSKGEPRQFDYETISDVILHFRYTAREGGGLLRQGAIDHGKSLFAEARAVGAVRLFSVRHEFPGEWAKFQKTPAEGQRRALALTLRPEHFPFWSRGRLGAIAGVDVLARSAIPGSLDVFDKIDDADGEANKSALAERADWGGLLVGKLTGQPNSVALPALEEEWKVFFDKPLTDLWLAVRWGE